jgi:hypothetical protein
MSKNKRKMKKVDLKCPQCNELTIRVMRATFRKANHPVIRRKGNIEVNWGKQLGEERRRVWLKLTCGVCKWESDELKDEMELGKKILTLIEYKPIIQGLIKPKPQSRKEHELPTIIRPSNYET